MLTVVSASGAATAEVASTPVTATATVAMRVLSFIWLVPLPFRFGCLAVCLACEAKDRCDGPALPGAQGGVVALPGGGLSHPLGGQTPYGAWGQTPTEPGGRPGSASGRRTLSR